MFLRIFALLVAFGLVGLAGVGAQASDGKPATEAIGRGRTIFLQTCATCHGAAGEGSGTAPPLAGVIGRKAGSMNFAYSPALRKSAVRWDDAAIDRFLTAPAKMIPGTRMMIAIPNAQTRAALIAYLRSL